MRARIETWGIPTPFPVGPVNAHRIDGARPALVDAGPRTPEASQALLARIETAPIEVLVVSHEHVDHAGLARELQRRGVKVWMHERAAQVLRDWERLAPAREADYAAGLQAAAVPPPHRERMRYGGRKYDAWSEPLIADATFRGGDRLTLGDHDWEVVDAPGHTSGSFLLTNGEQTFSGDTLLERITPNAVSVRDSERGALVSYLSTLRRVRGREWGTVYPGHGAPFDGVGRVIDGALRHAQLRQQRVLRELAAGPCTAWQLVERLFPRLPENQLFLAVSEVLGHLEVLRVEARLEVERADGVDRYRLLESEA